MAQAVGIDDFKNWTVSCGVFKVQKEYQSIVETAKEHNVTIQAEMQAQGYKDYNAFARSRRRFALTCYASEFAELGSGFVLFFHFLGFLMILLMICLVVNLPAMAYYGDKNQITEWYWHHWGSGWSRDDISCSCLSSNDGITGPNSQHSQSDYGVGCAAWDTSWCVQADSPFAEPGKWCCRSWCFAQSSCSAPQADSPSLWHRHYRGLVRATSLCAQNSSNLALCAQLPDSAFNEEGVELIPTGNFISEAYRTPGNLGPNGGNESTILVAYVIFTPVLGLVFMAAYDNQLRAEKWTDNEATFPNDFAILVKGLPKNVTDEKAILNFFRKNAIKGRQDAEIVKVVIGWNGAEYGEKIGQLTKLKVQLERLPQGQAKAKQEAELKQRIVRINNELAATASQQSAKLRSSGVAVVVFRYQEDLRACLSRWQGFWQHYWNSEARDTKWLPKGNGLLRADPLPQFPVGDRTMKKLRVMRAPNPGDINWMKLGVGKWKRFQALTRTHALMLLVIFCSFWTTWALDKLQEYTKDESAKRSGEVKWGIQALSLLPGMGIALVNILLKGLAKTFGESEYHDTHTEKEFSQAMKMGIGLMINTSGVLLFSNAQPQEWYEKGGLVDDIILVVATDAIMGQVFTFMDVPYLTKYRARRKIDPERLAAWNARIKKNSPPKTPEQRAELKVVREQIFHAKKAFEPSVPDNPQKYAGAVNSFTCVLFYMPLVPFLPILGLADIVIQYWVDKLMLLRWNKRPRHQDSYMAMWSLKFLKVTSPILWAASVFIFLTPSWENKGASVTVLAFATLFALAGSLIPMSLWWALICLPCKKSAEAPAILADDSLQDYYNAQHLWPKEMKYHKDQFLYKMLQEDKNPEMLKPGQECTIGAQDVSGYYSKAVQHVADTAWTTQAAPASGYTAGDAGGQDWWGWGGYDWSGYSAGYADTAGQTPDSATSYGKAANYDHGASGYTAGAAPQGAGPQAQGQAGYEWPAHTTTRQAAGGAWWEYESQKRSEYLPFDAASQAKLESSYQGYWAGTGRERVGIRHNGVDLVVDFAKMAMKTAKGKPRSVRRRDVE